MIVTSASDTDCTMCVMCQGCSGMRAGTGLGWAVILACVSAFQALSVNAYFFRLFRITCQLKARLRGVPPSLALTWDHPDVASRMAYEHNGQARTHAKFA